VRPKSDRVWTIRHWPRPLVLALCGLLIPGIGLVDYLTGMEASVTVIYLLPIALGTWALSRRTGLLLAVASVLVWLIVERIQAVSYSHPLIQCWNALTLLIFFVVVVLLVSVLGRSYEWLEEKVEERTAELLSEIAVRSKAEADLARANAELSQSREDLMHTLADLRKSHAALQDTQLRLIQAAKMESVGRLAAGVAHEVKNPLTTIMMGIDYVEQLPQARDEATAGVLKEQRDAVLRATAIINELLEFSTPGELHTQPEDLNAIIERALGLAKYELTKRHVVVARELQPDLPALPLDRNKIEQVFVNVFINALHAMARGGTLTVRTYATPAKPNANADAAADAQGAGQDRIGASVEVDDTGPGIPEEHLVRVFDPFFTTKAPGKGTGLGLSIVRQIVHMHGGTVDLANRAAGGARVTVRFFTTGAERS
jgi:signal transduction histidine kinase